jgi:hypothetical protein
VVRNRTKTEKTIFDGSENMLWLNDNQSGIDIRLGNTILRKEHIKTPFYIYQLAQIQRS